MMGSLTEWLVDAAYPRWAGAGIDPTNGGFQERVALDLTPLVENRRARVQTRQVYCFARAAEFGWAGDAATIIDHGLAWFFAQYRRPDGLFRTCVAADGNPVDDQALLYDQTFVLLALAACHKQFGTSAHEAVVLRDALDILSNRPGPGFRSGRPHELPLLSNPHMHLFEACLAWVEISDDPAWRRLTDEIGGLALERLIDPRLGVLREVYDADWSPAGRIVEPGHQFEWAWLLLRWNGPDPTTTEAALSLIDLAERHGVRNGVAVNALLDDFSIHDPAARLWPQCERLKAALSAARLTGEPLHRAHADEAARCLQGFLNVPTAGLWRDRLLPDGRYVEEPAPASSFYHIVAAIDALAAEPP